MAPKKNFSFFLRNCDNQSQINLKIIVLKKSCIFSISSITAFFEGGIVYFVYFGTFPLIL